MDRYRSRISGPLLDRVEVLIEVPPLSLDSLERDVRGETSEVIRSRVIAARAFRAARAASLQGRSPRVTASGGPAAGSGACRPVFLERSRDLTREALSLLRRALVTEGLSGRAYARVTDLARTIADLDNVPEVDAQHVAEALSLRLDYRRVGLG